MMTEEAVMIMTKLLTTTAMNKPVVLITGALSGIGRAAALAFTHESARIVVSGRRDKAGQVLAAELREIGAEAEFLHADVRHEDDVRNLVDQTVARFGRLDVAFNNAGVEAVGPLRIIIARPADTSTRPHYS